MTVPDAEVSVPVISPVLVLKLSAAGSDGDIAYVIVPDPPVALIGVSGDIAIPTSISEDATEVVELSGA